MMPLNYKLTKYTSGWIFIESRENINYFIYMDDIKNEKELETIILTTRIYISHEGMEFHIAKFTILIMKSVKRDIMEGIELPN